MVNGGDVQKATGVHRWWKKKKKNKKKTNKISQGFYRLEL